jgi:hypothetical protein
MALIESMRGVRVLGGVPGVALVQRSPQIKPLKVGDRRWPISVSPK